MIIGTGVGQRKSGPHKARPLPATDAQLTLKAAFKAGRRRRHNPETLRAGRRPTPERTRSAACVTLRPRAALLPSGKPDIAGTRQHERPTGYAARSPRALRVCGEHCDEIRRGWSQDPGSSWIFGVSGCNVARRNEKPAERRALRKPLVRKHLGLQVTGSRRDRATEYPTSLAALGHSDKLITPP